ncbi:MAG: fimbrillin family protein, partial [Alistipes sp.]|nr:fimbrillin family protein [Alistipes sp.]
MKKTLLMTCVAMLVAMTSCMKDEVVSENKGHVIGFRTAVDTRGLEADEWSLPYFLVTALEPGETTPYFENAQYVRDNVGEYVSSTDYYWPGNDRRLSFYAYAPKAEDMGGAEVTITNDEQSIAGFTVNPNISEQCDFIYAYNEGSDGLGLVEENGSVSLDFKHKLSKVYLYGYTGSERVFNCKGVRIGGVYNKGSMADLAGNVWTIDGDAQKSVFEKILDEPLTISNSLGGDYLIGKLVDIVGDSEEDNDFMIPQTLTAWDPVNDPRNINNGAYIAVYLQITTASGSRIYPEDPNVEYAWVAVPISGEWLTGYSYQYRLDFTKGAGYVAPDVNNPSSGSPVLGDATIKVVASLNGMEEATENMVVNPNM